MLQLKLSVVLVSVNAAACPTDCRMIFFIVLNLVFLYISRYDNKLIVYEASSMPGNRGSPLRALCTQHNAHDAGITCLIVAKDAHSSTW